jgi:hypothetical protein
MADLLVAACDKPLLVVVDYEHTAGLGHVRKYAPRQQKAIPLWWYVGGE